MADVILRRPTTQRIFHVTTTTYYIYRKFEVAREAVLSIAFKLTIISNPGALTIRTINNDEISVYLVLRVLLTSPRCFITLFTLYAVAHVDEL